MLALTRAVLHPFVVVSCDCVQVIVEENCEGIL